MLSWHSNGITNWKSTQNLWNTCYQYTYSTLNFTIKQKQTFKIHFPKRLHWFFHKKDLMQFCWYVKPSTGSICHIWIQTTTAIKNRKMILRTCTQELKKLLILSTLSWTQPKTSKLKLKKENFAYESPLPHRI